MTYRDLGILPVLWLVGTWGGIEGVGSGDKLIGRPGYGGGGDFFGGIGGRSFGGSENRFLGDWRQFFFGDWWQFFWGIGGSFFQG